MTTSPRERRRARTALHGRAGALVITGLAIAWGLALVAAAVAPTDAVQGHAQRLMYVHVPSAWSAFLCFGLVFLASGASILRERPVPDRVARAAAEVGVVMTALTLASGSIWGSMTWGTWWAWDARIVTTTALGLTYLGYLALHGLLKGPLGRRVVAVVGMAGFALVPVVHFSVLWWRTLHQPPTILDPALSPPIEQGMLVALAAAVVAFTGTVLLVIVHRARRRPRPASPDASPEPSAPRRRAAVPAP